MASDSRMAGGISREAAVLVCCARTSLSEEQAQRLQTLCRAGLDWDTVLDLAQQHGLMPLLTWHLQTLQAGVVPPTILAIFQEYFQTNAQHNLWLTQELLSILRLFAAHNIPVIPFKGPVLAAMVYHNLALRQFGDLDLFVPRVHIRQAAALLVAHGYQSVAPLAMSLSESNRFNYYVLTRHDDAIRVDLQWCITGVAFSFVLDTDMTAVPTTSFSLAGVPVPTFPPEDLLLILCIHGTKHQWSELKWLCDVAEFLRTQQTLAWDRVMARARQMSCTRMLCLGLYLVQELLDVRLPTQVAYRCQANAVVRALGAAVQGNLFTTPATTHHNMKEIIFYVRSMDGLRGKVQYCLPYVCDYVRRLLQPTAQDQAFCRLPASCEFFYYVIRPVRLLLEYGRKCFTRCFCIGLHMLLFGRFAPHLFC